MEAIDPDLISEPPLEIETETAKPSKSPLSAQLPSLVDPETDSELLLLEVEEAVLAKGIAFSGYRYDADDEERVASARRLALRSDILILDWNLANTDDGVAAVGFLDYLKGMTSGPRFIYIFTGQSDLGDVRDNIKSAFGSEPDQVAVADSMDFKCGDFAFAIRRKVSESTFEPGSLQAAHAVRPSGLIDNAIDALLEARLGLMELALLEITTRHRWHLDRMFQHLGRRYDAALLVEHAFVGSLDLLSGGGTLHEILFDEWRAQLSESAHGPELSILSTGGLEDYVRFLDGRLPEMPSPSAEQITAAKKEEPSPEERETIKAYKKSLRLAMKPLISSLEQSDGDRLIEKESSQLVLQAARFSAWLKSLASVPDVPFAHAPEPTSLQRKLACLVIGSLAAPGAPRDQEPFLTLQTLLSQRENLPARITQGTVLEVVAAEGGGQSSLFLICITPLCDAYRPEKLKHHFTFIQARPDTLAGASSGVEAALDAGTAVVVRHDTAGEVRPQVLRVVRSPIVALKVDDPTISPGARVEASPFLGDSTISLRPVAQLRRDHAFHLSHRALGQAGRIGLDHVEYVRAFKK